MIAAAPSSVVEKDQYDGAGRQTIRYATDGSSGTSWSAANSVTGDNVLTQVETTFDKDGNSIMVTERDRNHDETATGALGNPTTSPKARVYYSTSYYDLANRLTATVNVGTNGGSAYTRPSSVPSASDTVLLTQYAYTSAGFLDSTTDPRGIVTKHYYDALGRETKTVEAYDGGSQTSTTNKTTEYTYDGDGHVLTLKADEPGGVYQETQWTYGVTTSGGSDVNSNDILANVQYPDLSTGNPSSSYEESYTVNALGDTKTYTDRAGNVHTYTLDILGRVTKDAITTLATGFDGSIRRIETAYDTQGNPYLITSYDAPTGGNIVNQVQRAYNGLGQLTQEWQSHSGAVNTNTTPSVQYGYTLMAGGANHSRLTSMTYPNGKVLNYNYGSSGSLAEILSRVDSLSDASGTLEQYGYLGGDKVIQRARSQININLTYIKRTGESNGDAGDQYTGLDRFGRVVDQRWLNTSAGTHTDRFQYGYDRDSNPLYRNNLVNTAFGELYHASGAGYGYDNLNQLSGFLRGVLSASQQNGPLDTVSNPSITKSWSPDALGNFSSITTNGTTQTRNHNQQNEITSISGATTPTYDTNGNLTTDELGQTYKYDAWNRLVQVKNSGGTVIASYVYDRVGRRIQETHGGTVNDLYYSSNWQVLEERTGGVSTATVQYLWSPVYVDALVLRDRSTHNNGTMDERLWVQQDANWNVSALVNNSGTVVERYVYDPYGQVTYLNASWSTISGSAYAWIYGFQGVRLDTATSNNYSRHREYRPTISRFLQNDPIRYRARDNDLYRFERNLPTRLVDPTGNDSGLSWSWAGCGGGALTGGVTGGVVGAFVGAPLFGIGAVPGAAIGAGAGAAIGCVAGGLGAKPLAEAFLGRPAGDGEVFVAGLAIGVPAGVVGGIVGPLGWSLYTGAFWVSPAAGWLGIGTAGGGSAAATQSQRIVDAEQRYPNQVGNIPEWHHTWPLRFQPPPQIYWQNWPRLVQLPAPYHEVIDQEINQALPIGGTYSSQEIWNALQEIYTQWPLSGFPTSGIGG
jgi:RHS repeat-associated protein